MLPSLPPLTNTAPVGLQASAYTIAFGSLQACRRSPLCTSQTKSSPPPLLPPPLASRVPSGLQATLRTMPRCPWNCCSSVPSGAGGHLPHVQSLLIARTGQKLPIRTPRHAIEEGVDVVRVPQNLPSFSRGRIPQPDSIVQPATGQKPPIRTPRHPKHEGAMAAQQPGWGQALHLPDGHQRI